MYSNKIELDKFYTKRDIAKLCIDSIDVSCYDLIIEPSAGNGSFFTQIDHPNKIGIDLKPDIDGLIEMSWFDYKVDCSYQKVLVIGNPPFGKRNDLSKKFIKHAVDNKVYTIAFILPNVYNKHTMQKFFPKEYKLKKTILLPKDSFLVDEKSYHVPCSFYIFTKEPNIEDLRFDPSLFVDTKHWFFSTKDDYDFFVMGAAINTIKKVPKDKNRGYYIKVKSNFDIEQIKSNFKNLKIKGNSSVKGGVFWITKPELVKSYVDFYGDGND